MLGAAVDDVWTEADAMTPRWASRQSRVPATMTVPVLAMVRVTVRVMVLVTTSAGAAGSPVAPGCTATIGGSTPRSVRCTTGASREPGERTAPAG